VVDLARLTSVELLALQARIADELRSRGIARTSNNVTGDLAEYLFCMAFGWATAANSNAHIDAIDKSGARYQIKAAALRAIMLPASWARSEIWLASTSIF
jgi:hypothetical protein